MFESVLRNGSLQFTRIFYLHLYAYSSLAKIWFSTRNRIPSPLVFHRHFSTVECTRGGLGPVCETGMYRSIEHVKFPKFQTGIFVEWKAPLVAQGGTVSHCYMYILVIRNVFDFTSLFRHRVWLSFSVKKFPPAEFGICNIQLRIADKNGRRVEL